jgi:hypothetical protein
VAVLAAGMGLLVTTTRDGRAQQTGISIPAGSIRELLDLRSVARRKPWRTLQQSGYDRRGGYYDSGHFLRTEPGGRLVLLDAVGPGCIDRMWFTRKRPWQEPYDLLVYVDKMSKPVLRADLDELFSAARTPFVAPLAGRCGLERTPGLYSYVPIGYRDRCKIVLVPAAPDEQYQWRTTESGNRIRHVYYQITYRSLPEEAPVQPFRANLEARDVKALGQIAELWGRPGSSPWTAGPSMMSRSRKVTVPARQATELLRLNGPGVIYELRLKLEDSRPRGVSDEPLADLLDLEMTWDGASKPQVSAAIGALFACPDARQDVAGFWCGCLDGTYYTYLPMPFARSARIRVHNRAGRDATMTAWWTYRQERLDPSDCHLSAHRYDIATPRQGLDNVLFQRRGAGHVVAMVMDRPGHMEGDDRWFVDGQQTPSIHGTGTEDFFNFAWGLGGMEALPMHGMTQHFGRPVCYRFMFPAAVPFHSQIRLICEHGHSLADGPNRHQGRYSGVVIFYTN